MKALIEVWRHKKYAALQFALEFTFFLLIFLLSLSWLKGHSGDSYYSYRFHLLHYLSNIAGHSSLSLFVNVFLILLVLAYLMRIFLHGGLFSLYAGETPGFSFWEACARYFLRFLLLAVLFLIPVLLISQVFASLLGKIVFTDNTRLMPVFWMLRQLLVFLVLVFFSYLQARSRYATIEKKGWRISFRISLRGWLIYTGYNLLGLAFLIAFSLAALLLFFRGNPFLAFLSVLLWQLAVASHLLFRLAAFQSDADH